ncbi:MAG: histidine kinase dimerization/phospho-acceptor domain-containing protein [candidate division Zixibacteria bacterium]|nr:histidine kinase dimerization/phospho-acceptor domain-containing protein [candidate division Zixibacteria bacterium]
MLLFSKIDFVDALKRFAIVAALLVSGIGLITLFSYLSGLEHTVALYPDSLPMPPLTAVAFIGAGLALFFAKHCSANPRILLTGKLLTGLVGVVGLIKIALTLSATHGTLAHLSVPFLSVVELGDLYSRVSNQAAICFILFSLSTWLYYSKSQTTSRVAQTLTIALGAFSFLIFVGYLYGVDPYINDISNTSMAFVTSFSFVLLSLGTLCLQPTWGIMGIVTSQGLGGIMIRRLLPLAFLVPLGLRAFRYVGENIGLFGIKEAVVIENISLVILLTICLFIIARFINRLDAERIAAVEDLHLNVIQLEVANRKLAAFNNAVSHDLRAPLRSIEGLSTVLVEDHRDKLDDEGRRLLQRIGVAAKKMGSLITELLSLSRVSTIELRIERVDLSEIARSLIKEFEQSHPDRAVECKISNGLVVTRDINLLRIALENLLSNAWKYPSKTRLPQIEFGSTKIDDRLVYFIKDNGAGFDMTYADKLLNPFQRLHRVGKKFAGSRSDEVTLCAVALIFISLAPTAACQ